MEIHIHHAAVKAGFHRACGGHRAVDRRSGAAGLSDARRMYATSPVPTAGLPASGPSSPLLETGSRRARLREAARRRGGVFTVADARRAGFSRARLRTAVGRGDWMVLRRGVLAERTVVAHCAEDPSARHALLTAADLAAVDGGRVAVGPSAACVLGLETLGAGPDRVSLSASRRDESNPGGGHGFRSSRTRTLVSYLPPEHRTSVYDLGCTTVVRTVVDLARTGPAAAAVVAMDAAARQFGTTTERLREVSAFQAGWPYARRIDRAIAQVDERSESVLETLGRLSLQHADLPAPVVQAWIGESRAEVRVDLLVPGLWVVGEGDGRLKYTDPRALWEEKKRQERVEDLGFTVVRFDWDDATRRPRRLAERFEAAARRARPGVGRVFPDPSWWLDRRRAAWERARRHQPWWLPDLTD